MGAAASVHGHEGELTLEQAKQLAGNFWNQAQWDQHAENGVLHRNKFKDVIRGADPEFIWALYDKDGSGSIQVSELTGLLNDLNMSEGDEDLDTAMAEMELEEMDSNMDNKLEKKEFMKWLDAKKKEIADMEPTKKPSNEHHEVHHTAKDDNAWGNDPAHHAAATRIQAVHRGRVHRRTNRQESEPAEIVEFDANDEELNRAARKIQAHARGRQVRTTHPHAVHEVMEDEDV